MNKYEGINFEKELPEGYKQALYINAKSAKMGLLMNFIALIVLIIVMVLACLSLKLYDQPLMKKLNNLDVEYHNTLISMFVFLFSMIAYIVLHELVHGIAYKKLTNEKLTFGFSWSCAFCGVPNIYTYRKTAIISVLAPFVFFSIVFIIILVILYFVNPIYYLMAAFIFGLHVGGCSGDLYVYILFKTKFKNKNTLMRDTGPEQFFYIKEDNN